MEGITKQDGMEGITKNIIWRELQNKDRIGGFPKKDSLEGITKKMV